MYNLFNNFFFGNIFHFSLNVEQTRLEFKYNTKLQVADLIYHMKEHVITFLSTNSSETNFIFINLGKGKRKEKQIIITTETKFGVTLHHFIHFHLERMHELSKNI